MDVEAAVVDVEAVDVGQDKGVSGRGHSSIICKLSLHYAMLNVIGHPVHMVISYNLEF